MRDQHISPVISFKFLKTTQLNNFLTINLNDDLCKYISNFILIEIYNQIFTGLCHNMYLFDCENVFNLLKFIRHYDFDNTTILSIVRGWYITSELYIYDSNYLSISSLVLNELNLNYFKWLDSENLIKIDNTFHLNTIGFQYGLDIVHSSIYGQEFVRPNIFYETIL